MKIPAPMMPPITAMVVPKRPRWRARPLLGKGGMARLLILSGRLIYEDLSAFHDEDNAANGGDVLERVAIERDDVRLEAGSDRADAVLQAEGFRAQGVRGDERGHWALSASLDAIKKFLRVTAVGAGNSVGPEDDFETACSDGVTEELLIFGQHFFHDGEAFFCKKRRAEVMRFVVEIVLDDQAGLGVKVGAALGEEAEILVGSIKAVLDLRAAG